MPVGLCVSIGPPGEEKEESVMRKIKMLIPGIFLCAALFTGCTGNTDSQEDTVESVSTVAQEETVGTPENETDTSDGEKSGETDEDISQAANKDAPEAASLPDGVYMAAFNTDSGMFHVSEACDGKGTLTVENGKMMIHISLGSKKIVNLYPGLAEDAAKEGATLLMPTEDSVTYSDGITEEVYGFDVPVPVLEEEFDLALIGTKGKWYDHKVSVSNPEPLENREQEEETGSGSAGSEESAGAPADGTYEIELTFEGGSGKAKILSPAVVTVTGKKAVATVQWDSPNYDYMIVDGEKFLPVNTQGDSVFEIPVPEFDEPVSVIGDTVAMSKPHEVEYTLIFHSDTVKPVE